MLISYELSIWYDDSLIEMTGTKHRGLAPHKITPMLGVLGRGGLESVFLKWLIFRSAPVNPAVELNRCAERLQGFSDCSTRYLSWAFFVRFAQLLLNVRDGTTPSEGNTNSFLHTQEPSHVPVTSTDDR